MLLLYIGLPYVAQNGGKKKLPTCYLDWPFSQPRVRRAKWSVSLRGNLGGPLIGHRSDTGWQGRLLVTNIYWLLLNLRMRNPTHPADLVIYSRCKFKWKSYSIAKISVKDFAWLINKSRFGLDSELVPLFVCPICQCLENWAAFFFWEHNSGILWLWVYRVKYTPDLDDVPIDNAN